MASDDGEKKKLSINYDELFREGDDEPVPNVVVVSSANRRRRRPPENKPTEVSTATQTDCGELSSLSMDQLKGKISRLTSVLNGQGGRNLPDKGEKLKRQIAGLEEELQRRNNREVADECKDPEFSEFGNLLLEKMGTGVKPKPDQNAAFQDEISYINPRAKQNRNTGAKLSCNKKAKYGLGSKEFAPWKHNNGSQSRQKYCSLGNLLSRPSAQEKLPVSVTLRNGFNDLSSKCTNDDKEECTVVLVDEEEPDTTQRIQEPEKRRSRRNECKIFYPSREDPESLEIFRSELKCLEPGECLTSTIMNFYIRYLQQMCSTSDRSKQKFYFFNTYFYSKLQEAMTHENEETFFIKFRRWWKGVNIFEKTYIFLPVNEDKHWSLVILCISDEEDSGPIILHLDSLGLHYSRLIIKNVKSLLENEWKYLKESGEAVNIPIPDTLKENLSQRIDGKTIEAPRQTNDYDCGLFVLYYIERFIEDAPEKMRDEYLSMFGKKWFKAQEASSLRSRIKNILMDEFRKIPTDDNSSLWEPVCLPSPVTRAKAAHLADMS
ncbi:ubiquitin-like-specific protease 1D [Silene latifolia]|uniref:ubiquitin-like-specific protease 1D n=1 Tax=Silene latifolia TaxID=37657 RepID=UPI003D7730CB